MTRSILLFRKNRKERQILDLLQGPHDLVLIDSRRALLRAVKSSGSGCVVADLDPLDDGDARLIEAVRFHRAGPMPVVVVTEPTEVRTAVMMMRAGAVDVLEKPVSASRLLDAVAKAFDEADQVYGRREVQLYRTLSSREQEVAALLAAGRTSRQTGEILGISHRTVDIYRGKLLRKLGVPNTAALASIIGRLT